MGRTDECYLPGLFTEVKSRRQRLILGWVTARKIVLCEMSPLSSMVALFTIIVDGIKKNETVIIDKVVALWLICVGFTKTIVFFFPVYSLVRSSNQWQLLCTLGQRWLVLELQVTDLCLSLSSSRIFAIVKIHFHFLVYLVNELSPSNIRSQWCRPTLSKHPHFSRSRHRQHRAQALSHRPRKHLPTSTSSLL